MMARLNASRRYKVKAGLVVKMTLDLKPDQKPVQP